jgi:hypothetical protein
MLSIYGKDFAESGTHLSGESMAKLWHWAPTIETAPQELRTTFVRRIKQGGDDFVLWVDKRWRETAVAGGLTVALITAYKVGDGIADAIPNPGEKPLGWLVFWLPLLIGVGILAIAYVLRHIFSDWIKTKTQREVG